MSFLEENQHFFRQKIVADMKSLSAPERMLKYKHSLALETRNRLKAYYLKMKTTEEKRKFYSEILDYLGQFESSFILYSIFFEKDSSQLFAALNTKFSGPIFQGFDDKFGVLKTIGASSEENQTNRIFAEYLKLKLPVQANELNNPEANRLSEWLAVSLKNKDLEHSALLVLLHFTKYWSQNYRDNYSKGVVLLNKIERAILDLGLDKLKINFKDALRKVKMICDDLVFQDVVAPYIDTIEAAKSRDKQVINGYINKLNDFSALLNKSEIFFKDLKHLSLIDLYQAHCSQEKNSIRIYEVEIRNRVKLGALPTSEDLEYFSDPSVFEKAKESDWRFSMINFILRSNYIFY
ncbi:MAG: hypothetical protein DI539_25185 [Flavobacterium psychrophilum]|nr:MAG: hypothetical protein DI539_25185 [Flavobacterium psychrophilum]